MPVRIIDTIKPKNNGSFPIVEAIDVAVSSVLRLPEALESKADASALEATNEAVAAKANATDLEATNAALAAKADATDVSSLQNQIDQIEISASAESVVAPEVAAARVDSDGVSHATLKARIDSSDETMNKLVRNGMFEASVISGYLIKSDGTIESSDLADASCTDVTTCYPGETFIFKGKADYSFYAVAWYNGSVLISTAQTGHSVEVAEFTAPQNANRCRFSSYGTSDFYVYSKDRKTTGNISKQGEAIEGLQTEIESADTEIENNRSFVDSLFDSSVNLFDKDSEGIIAGKHIISSGIADDPDDRYKVSHAIPVKKGVTYKFNIVYSEFGNNSVNVFISDTEDVSDESVIFGTAIDSNKFVTFTAPYTGFVRINLFEDSMPTKMFCVSDLYPAEYTAYSTKIKEQYIATKAENIEGYIEKEQVDFIIHEISANLLNKSDVIQGSYFDVNNNGQIANRSDIFRTFIPVTAGSYSMLVDASFFGASSASKLCLFNANKNFVGLAYGTVTGSSHASEAHFNITQSLIDTYGAVYFGYNGYLPIINSLMIVHSATYPSEYIPYVNRFVLDDDIEVDVPFDQNAQHNLLHGKKVVFDGDSICEATSEGSPALGWAGRIGNGNEMDWHNVGRSGGTITAETYSGGAALHWVCRYIDTIHNNYPTLDYLILEGGTNDADRLGMAGIGELDMTDFSGEYDDTNFTGALDSLFYKALSYYPDTKIGFIVAQKMGTGGDYTVENNTRRKFFERAMQACYKWGITFINLWDCSQLNPKLPVYFNPSLDAQGNRDGGYSYIDGQHLTSKGYDIISPKIEAWMRML